MLHSDNKTCDKAVRPIVLHRNLHSFLCASLPLETPPPVNCTRMSTNVLTAPHAHIGKAHDRGHRGCGCSLCRRTGRGELLTEQGRKQSLLLLHVARCQTFLALILPLDKPQLQLPMPMSDWGLGEDASSCLDPTSGILQSRRLPQPSTTRLHVQRMRPHAEKGQSAAM